MRKFKLLFILLAIVCSIGISILIVGSFSGNSNGIQLGENVLFIGFDLVFVIIFVTFLFMAAKVRKNTTDTTSNDGKPDMNVKIDLTSQDLKIINAQVTVCRYNGNLAVYVVTVTSDGGEYIAYSNTCYDRGYPVLAAVIKGKKVKILSDDEIKELRSNMRECEYTDDKLS